MNFGNLDEHHKVNTAGRGLGLSICKQIIEKMCGTVEVTSEVNKGSIFSMIFKVMCRAGGKSSEEIPPDVQEGADQAREEGKSESDLKMDGKPRLLLVNDE